MADAGELLYQGGVTEALIEWLRAWPGLSFGSGLALAGVFVLASVAFVPRSLLLFASGAIFGTSAIVIAWSGLVLGALLAFVVARFILADRVQRWLATSRRFRAVADAVDAEGWKIVALLRLGSPFSNTMQNYVFGLTRIGFTPYALATAAFMMPQTALLVYLGAAGRQALVHDGRQSPVHYVLLVSALVSLLAVSVLIWRKTRAALDERGLDSE